MGDAGKPQLCPPQRYAEHGDDFSHCQRFSVVAWDHVSWPGNDFYGGARATDDGRQGRRHQFHGGHDRCARNL